MNPKIRATLEIALSAFGIGALSYLAPILQGGALPDKAAWGSILTNAVVAGALAAYHRIMPSPSVIAMSTETKTVEVKS